MTANDLTNREEQQALVQAHRATRAAYNRALDAHAAQFAFPLEIGIDESNSAFVDSEAYQKARAAGAQLAALEAEYFRRLPRLALSCCPLCEKPLYRSFDPFGLDGLWWRSDSEPDEPQACPHFCLLLGAVDLAGQYPQPDFDVQPGPGAPYVIPRLLEQPGMVAVLARVALADGTIAYPIAYFSPRRPPVQTLTASWARSNFPYTTQLGVHAWRMASEPALGQARDAWDYDLARWLTRDKLRWCDPEGDRTTLSTAAPSACPFIGLPGTKYPVLVLAAGTVPA
ncbi:MAG TPA: hypothetical protein VFK05_26540 [Polyangiaceae bacterium]|nr:hypothetical protein [Polyangiaceae bacterium]